MTVKLYWEYPYLSQWETRIAAVDGCRIRLEETILYPFAGGQERDFGTIGNYPVLETCTQGQDIFYQVPEGHGLRSGDVVPVRIDWPRRYRLMRLHLAAELVLELVYRRLAGIEKIGAHIAEHKSRLDFYWTQSLKPLLPELSGRVQQLVDENLPVISAFSDPRTGRRYWEISGFARVSCGGTHLRSTGEIGTVTLKRVNIGQGKERIEIVLDDRTPPAPQSHPEEH